MIWYDMIWYDMIYDMIRSKSSWPVFYFPKSGHFIVHFCLNLLQLYLKPLYVETAMLYDLALHTVSESNTIVLNTNPVCISGLWHVFFLFNLYVEVNTYVTLWSYALTKVT